MVFALNSTLGCIRKGVASRSRDVILLLCTGEAIPRVLCSSAGHGHAATSVRGEAERPEIVQPEGEKAQGDASLYKHFAGEGRRKKDSARLISVEPGKRRKVSGHKLNYNKFHLNIRKIFFTGQVV